VSTENQIENEVKIRLAGIEDGLSRLQAAGFIVRRERVFEVNIIYDTPQSTLRNSNSLLRLRQIGSECILTFKGPAEGGRHKTREELETSVGDFGAADAILRRLGYAPAFRYEKFRTEFGKDGEPGTVTLDETPIGVFFELEGPTEWVDDVAKRLGFNELDYITESYGSLYMAHCTSLGVPPSDMVFRP
jgi:adenylate cyclase class 2